jgi:hypothetical protein
MKIVEQSFIATDRMTSVKVEYPAETLFQVFVKGKLQYRPSYLVEEGNIVFGFDCLQAGDIVQIFYLLS